MSYVEGRDNPMDVGGPYYHPNLHPTYHMEEPVGINDDGTNYGGGIHDIGDIFGWLVLITCAIMLIGGALSPKKRPMPAPQKAREALIDGKDRAAAVDYLILRGYTRRAAEATATKWGLKGEASQP